jgi:hypothetical protein
MARDPERPAVDGVCPLCDNRYTVKNNQTKHHIFPGYWYGKRGTVKSLHNRIHVLACERCHQVEFNRFYPMRLDNPWTKSECITNWIKFCTRKGKDAIRIYPQLGKLFT